MGVFYLTLSVIFSHFECKWIENSSSPLLMILINYFPFLRQVQAHKFPPAHNYHGVPLPWLQIKLLKTLAHLGSADERLAASLLPVLTHTLHAANTKEMIWLAVVEECLQTIATLAKGCGRGEEAEPGMQTEREEGREMDGAATAAAEAERAAVAEGAAASSYDGGGRLGEGSQEGSGAKPKTERGGAGRRRGETWLAGRLQPLLEEASKCVARFLSSGVANLRYQGIKSLAQLVTVNAELASHHQMAVLRCLDDPDSIIRRQTLTLLYHMANPANARVVCSQLLEHVHRKDSNPGLQADVAGMVCDIGCRMVPDPVWYLRTLLPLLSLPLESGRRSSITRSMLQFFTKATQDPLWPAFPKLLFTTMVDSVQESDAGATPAVVFALKALRFVPPPAGETVSGGRFLTACAGLLECEKQESAVKEQVVLCVQELLLRGCLERPAALQWARSALDKCDHSTLRQYRQKLGELLALASLELDKDLSSLSTLKPRAPVMDFSLSFADAYSLDTCRKGQSILKTPQFARAADAAHVDRPGVLRELSSVTLTSPTSELTASSATPPSHDSSSLDADSSLGESCSLRSPPSTLQSLPAVKRVWTKEGFAGGAEARARAATAGVAGSTVLSESRTAAADEAQRGGTAAAKELRDREELARALFQGLSRSASATSSRSSSSQVSTATDSHHSLLASASNVSSSSSQNSTAASSQDTLVASAPASFSPSQSQSSLATSCPDTALAASASDLRSPSIGAGETDLSWPALPPVDSSGWKALNAGHRGTQATECGEADQQSSPTVTSERVLSDLGSESTLSISDDSLENVRDLSLQNSPAKQPVRPSASLGGDGAGLFGCECDDNSGHADSEDQDQMFTQFLQVHLGEFENPQTTAEHTAGCGSSLVGNAGSESLYSGFEDLAPYINVTWEEEEEIGEESQQMDNDRPETATKE